MEFSKNIKILQLLLLLLVFSFSYCQREFQITPNSFVYGKLIENDTKVSFTFNMKVFGWVGLVFSDKMAQKDIIIVILNEDGSVEVKDTWASRKTYPKDDTDATNGFSGGVGTYDISNVKSKKLSDGSTSISFERLLDTKDANDFIINVNSEQVISFAWKEQKPFIGGGKHTAYLRSTLKFSQKSKIMIFGQNQDIEVSYDFYDVHGLAQFIAWTIFNFLGFISIRHFKHIKYARFFHLFGSGFSAFSTVILGSMAIDKSYGLIFDFSEINNVHSVVGYFMFIIILVQVCLGFINSIFIYILAQRSHFIHKFKNIHKVLGFLLTFAIHFMLITGFSLKYPDLSAIAITTAVLFPVMIIVIELFFKHSDYNSNQVFAMECIYNDKFKNLPSFSKKEFEEQSKDKSLVLIDNLVCDVTDFIEHHPGGKNNLVASIGQDVTRYLTGTVPASKHFSNHKHNLETIKYAIEKYSIGKLTEDHKLIIDYSTQTKGDSIYVNNVFDWIETSKICKDAYRVIFKSKYNEQRFALGLPGVDFIGKHYALTSKCMKKTRLYSVCLILNEKVNAEHRKLIDSLLNIVTSDNENTDSLRDSLNPPNTKIKDYSSKFSIYLKRYENSESMSYYLTNNSFSDDDITIKGPIGVGLSLPVILEGTYVALAGGTGVFCFLDFAAFTLRYMNYLIRSNEGKIYESEDFSFVQKSFKLIYFSSFTDEESSIMHHFCLNMKRIDENYNLGVFDFKPRVSKIDKFKWDKNYITNELDKHANLITKVFLCGPQGMLDDLKEILLSIVSTDKIHFV